MQKASDALQQAVAARSTRHKVVMATIFTALPLMLLAVTALSPVGGLVLASALLAAPLVGGIANNKKNIGRYFSSICTPRVGSRKMLFAGICTATMAVSVALMVGVLANPVTLPIVAVAAIVGVSAMAIVAASYYRTKSMPLQANNTYIAALQNLTVHRLAEYDEKLPVIRRKIRRM